VGEPDPVGLGGEPKQAAIGVEPVTPTRLDELETGLLAAIEQALANPAVHAKHYIRQCRAMAADFHQPVGEPRGFRRGATARARLISKIR